MIVGCGPLCVSPPEVYNCLLDACIECRQLPRALALFQAAGIVFAAECIHIHIYIYISHTRILICKFVQHDIHVYMCVSMNVSVYVYDPGAAGPPLRPHGFV